MWFLNQSVGLHTVSKDLHREYTFSSPMTVELIVW